MTESNILSFPPSLSLSLFLLLFVAVRAFGGSKYGAGNGPIFFRDAACAGTEYGLSYCISNTDTSGCTHSDDAGIQCNGDLLPPAATPVGPGVTRPPPGLRLFSLSKIRMCLKCVPCFKIVLQNYSCLH